MCNTNHHYSMVGIFLRKNGGYEHVYRRNNRADGYSESDGR